MNNGTDRKPTPQQLRELSGITQGKVAEIIATYYASTTFDEIQALLEGGGRDIRGKIEQQLTRLFVVYDDPYSAQRALWEKYSREIFDLNVDLSQVPIPTKPREGKWRLLANPHGLNANHAAASFKKIITAHDVRWQLRKESFYLDAWVTKNARTSATESYFVWVRDEPEPDREYLGKRAFEADPDTQIGETLTERLVHGAVYFVETKLHLDTKYRTLCTGSRTTGGRVPTVYCLPDDREVCVSASLVRNADFFDEGLRQAVSL